MFKCKTAAVCAAVIEVFEVVLVMLDRAVFALTVIQGKAVVVVVTVLWL